MEPRRCRPTATAPERAGREPLGGPGRCGQEPEQQQCADRLGGHGRGHPQQDEERSRQDPHRHAPRRRPPPGRGWRTAAAGPWPPGPPRRPGPPAVSARAWPRRQPQDRPEEDAHPGRCPSPPVPLDDVVNTTEEQGARVRGPRRRRSRSPCRRPRPAGPARPGAGRRRRTRRRGRGRRSTPKARAASAPVKATWDRASPAKTWPRRTTT